MKTTTQGLSARTAGSLLLKPGLFRTIHGKGSQCHQRTAFYLYLHQTGPDKSAALHTGKLELHPGSHKSTLTLTGTCASSLETPGDLSRQLLLSVCNQKEISSILYPAGKFFFFGSLHGNQEALLLLLHYRGCKRRTGQKHSVPTEVSL